MPTEPQSPEPVECSVTIEAEPEVVFPFFTDPGKIVNWMGERARLSPEPGGIHRVELPVGFTALGEFVEVDPPRRVVFSWGWEHDDALVPPERARSRSSWSRLPRAPG